MYWYNGYMPNQFKQTKTPWSDGEVKLLSELYPKTRVKDLANHFPKRTKPTIVAKALSLGLPSAKLWQEKESKILVEKFRDTSEKHLLELLPKRTWPSILAQGERLSLKRNRQKPRIQVNEDYFSHWSSSMAYILGFILADGCIINGTYKGYSDSLKFGVQCRDIDILEKIKLELSSNHKISKGNNAAHFTITSQKIVDDLKRLGIKYRKSLNENVPKVPNVYNKDFIRGVVDGDGSIRFDNRNYPALSVYGGINTITHIRAYFFRELGAYSTLTRLKYSEQCKAYLYSISYRSNTAKKLIIHLYNDSQIYLERKFLLAKRCLDLNIRPRLNSRIYKI